MKLGHRPKRQLLSTANDRNGIVSTYVSMGIVSVLGLISISFAALMQTEYTQARDRQFNTQARHQAETAINDARQLVYKAIGDRLNLSQFIAEHNITGPPICLLGPVSCTKPVITRDVDLDGDGNIDNDELEATINEIDFYDANSDGKVDIDDDILQRPYDTLLIEEWYDCGDTTVGRDGFEGDLSDPLGSSPDPIIGYTCVEVDGRPVKLVYDDIDTNRSKNILLQTRLFDDATNKFPESNIDTLVVNWQGSEGPALNRFQEASVHEQTLYPEAQWSQPAPMLRMQIIPLNIRDGWTREELNKATRTYYLYPTKYDSALDCIDNGSRIALYSNWTVPIDPLLSPTCQGTVNITGDGKIINADCDGDESLVCTVEISGFDGRPLGTTYDINNADSNIGNKSDLSATDDEMVYIVLIRPIYKFEDSRVEISARNKSGDELRFVNQQVNITSTGIAGGLTYRLREVIPIRPKYNRPEFAIDSAEHICKVLIGEPNTGVSYDFTRIQGTYNNPIGTQTLDEEAFCADLHP